MNGNVNKECTFVGSPFYVIHLRTYVNQAVMSQCGWKSELFSKLSVGDKEKENGEKPATTLKPFTIYCASTF
jgi:hypothetical protein